MGSEVKFEIFLKLFTNENTILLYYCAQIQFLILVIARVAISDKVL